MCGRIVLVLCNFVIDFTHTMCAHTSFEHTLYSVFNIVQREKKKRREKRNSIQFNKYHIAINKHKNDERAFEWRDRGGKRERECERERERAKLKKQFRQL